MNSPLKSNWSPEGCLSLISKYLWNLQVAPEEKKIEGVSEPIFLHLKVALGPVLTPQPLILKVVRGLMRVKLPEVTK